MSRNSQARRAALIVLTRDGPAPAILGKSLSERQLEFALAAGCDRVVLLGDGASAAVIALRHRAEAAKARVQVVSDAHSLAGSVGADDDLLVLQQDVLPESADALAALRDGPVILVLPAGIGVQAGFERIDLERASAGALIVPGALLPKLLDLPEDSDAHGALLRIALQQRLPEKGLGEGALSDGSWAMTGPASDAGHLQESWVARHLGAATGCSLSSRISHLVLRRTGVKLLELRHALAAMLAATLLLLGGAVAAAWDGFAAIGFAAIALAAPVVGAAIGFARLKTAPFGSAPRIAAFRLLLDAALLAACYGAIDGSWLHRLFPSLVLLAALHASRREDSGQVPGVVRDRFLIAGAIAIFAAFGLSEEGIMAASVTVLAANLAAFRPKRG